MASGLSLTVVKEVKELIVDMVGREVDDVAVNVRICDVQNS